MRTESGSSAGVFEPGNGGNDIERRAHGSLGIVLVRTGIAEIGQYPVAPEIGKEAVKGERDTGAGGLKGIDHGAHVLWIESGRQSSRAHQIADHHGQVTALGSHGGVVARWPVRFALGGCTGSVPTPSP